MTEKPFGYEVSFSLDGTKLYIIRANDAAAASSDCILNHGMDSAKLKVILEANNGNHFVYLESQGQAAGHITTQYKQSGSIQNLLHFYDKNGNGYNTPSAQDEVWIVRGTPIIIGFSETAEALGSAILWGTAFHPPQLPLSGTGMLYHPFKMEDLYAPSVNGNVLAATTLPPLGGIQDNSILAQGDVTNGQTTLQQMLPAFTRLRIGDL